MHNELTLEDPGQLLNQLRKVHLTTVSNHWEVDNPQHVTLSIPEPEVTSEAQNGFHSAPPGVVNSRYAGRLALERKDHEGRARKGGRRREECGT